VWVCIGFKADSDPGSQTNAGVCADPDPSLVTKKIAFLHENYTGTYFKLIIAKRSKNLPVRQETRCLFWSISVLLDPDPDPGQPNQWGSRSTTLEITTQAELLNTVQV
jgi:hypothetical protein